MNNKHTPPPETPKERKHIHFIGICGVAMSALAIAFHEKGYKVTGSDKGFYPPVSTHLKKSGIEYYPGWHVDKMTERGDPDLVIVGNVAGSQNPEWTYVQEHNLEYKSYPEAVAEFFVADTSIVCAGSYGKTTTTTLLSWIFTQAGKDPSYMFGALSVNNIPAAHIGNGNTSILEGDEYKSARWDMRPKFAHYLPTHLLLTAVEWDHADIYETEQKYLDTFAQLVSDIPDNGLLVVHEDVEHYTQKASCKSLTYGTGVVDYKATNTKVDEHGLSFTIEHGSESYNIESYILGTYNIANITGAFAMAHQLGIDPDDIVTAITSFKGIKRRLEKRLDADVMVIDDIAHSPAKASYTLKNITEVYKGNVFAIFEPNTGNRQVESAPSYDNAFVDADTVIIPRLTKIKIDPTKKEQPFDGPKLRDVIAQTHDNVIHIEDDEELVSYIAENVKKEDVVVFLGSHGFRGMIEQVVDRLK